MIENGTGWIFCLRPVVGFPGYFISKTGEVWSQRTNSGKLGRSIRSVKVRERTERASRNCSLQVNGKSVRKPIWMILRDAFGGIANLDGEEWRPVERDPRYKVSNMGRAIGARGELLSFPPASLYPMITIGSDTVKSYLHRLVYEAFHGPIPDGMEVCHENGDSKDCRLSNLRIDTHAGNMADTHRHGTSNEGERHPLAQLTEADVVRIRKLCSEGRTHQSVADEYGKSRQHISAIVSRRFWRHLN